MIQSSSIYSSTANHPTKATSQPPNQRTKQRTSDERANKPTELSKSGLVLSSHLTCLIPIEKGAWWQRGTGGQRNGPGLLQRCHGPRRGALPLRLGPAALGDS